jgi:hypothetical protein
MYNVLDAEREQLQNFTFPNPRNFFLTLRRDTFANQAFPSKQLHHPDDRNRLGNGADTTIALYVQEN